MATSALGASPRKAFVLRIAPSGIDKLPVALRDNEIIIGWSEAKGLTDANLEWGRFRDIVYQTYYPEDQDKRRAGIAAGQLWRFIRDMEVGSTVVVPTEKGFYVAEVTGAARHDREQVNDDTAHRRTVKWLNNKKAIPRSHARAALQTRMKFQQTVVEATDLLPEIDDVLEHLGKDKAPSFDDDFQRALVVGALREIRTGRLDPYGFERLVAGVLKSLGAVAVEIVPRQKDLGADILATFQVARTFPLTLAVQAKHYDTRAAVGPDVVDQLVRGMDATGTKYGWVVTSGTFSEEAAAKARQLVEDRGLHVELIDGDQLAAMIVESGVPGSLNVGRI